MVLFIESINQVISTNKKDDTLFSSYHLDTLRINRKLIILVSNYQVLVKPKVTVIVSLHKYP